MKWKECQTPKCTNIISSLIDNDGNETAIWCLECWQNEHGLVEWEVENWGHWKKRYDIVCRCCHAEAENLPSNDFLLDGAL